MLAIKRSAIKSQSGGVFATVLAPLSCIAYNLSCPYDTSKVGVLMPLSCAVQTHVWLWFCITIIVILIPPDYLLHGSSLSMASAWLVLVFSFTCNLVVEYLQTYVFYFIQLSRYTMLLMTY